VAIQSRGQKPEANDLTPSEVGIQQRHHRGAPQDRGRRRPLAVEQHI